MQQFIGLRLAFIAVIACGIAAAAWSADFTQPERTPEFSAACRRQDKELKKYFTDLIPGNVSFYSLGSFRGQIHREGLTRTVKLIPVRSIQYPDFAAFREAARKKSQVIGILILTYTNAEPFIVPGTHLVTYDGYQASILDVHGYSQAELEAELGPVLTEVEVDPVIGSLAKTGASLCNILPEGVFQFYLQLVDANGDSIIGEDGAFAKCLFQIPLPGIVTDDDSPNRELATPPEEKP